MTLPSGTVSLLFSDIEGSTALLARLGDTYREALDGQRRILRQAWSDHDGIEMGTEGDSFFVVFSTAPTAVAAAVQAQRRLTDFDWPGGSPVKVRMGIHTGSPTPHDGGYVGMDVHRAARIAAAAHGGQVVISASTADLTQDELPEGVGLRDLGSYRLKDISRPDRLFQLVVDGLPADFAPLKALGTASSLPRPTTPLVGRDGELRELTALMSATDVRLVTLTGPGGSGKTRLAVGVAERLADRFPDGVYFVDLSSTTASSVMWTTIAEALDVPPEGRIPPGLFDHLAHRTALFVLDNLEQIEGASAVVNDLLREAAHAVVIATSRRPLRVLAEHEHAVPPLELPNTSDLAAVEKSGAAQMFAHHAQRVRSSFELTRTNAADVTEICRRLDGLPLAIELAAARSKLLSPSALLARLETAMDLKATVAGLPGRHQTLRQTVAWSYDLLHPDEQAVFRRLGAFAGGADLDAVSMVCSDALSGRDVLDMVGELLDASLVWVGDDLEGEPRVGMLVTVRTYARSLLVEHGELDFVLTRHAQYYTTVAEELERGIMSPGRLAHQRTFETELDNFREALSWALASELRDGYDDERLELGQALCSILPYYWETGGYFDEARQWLERSAARAPDRPSLLHAANLSALASALMRQGEHSRSRELAEEAVAIAQPLGDSRELVSALGLLAWGLFDTGEQDMARRTFEEARGASDRLAVPKTQLWLLDQFAAFETEDHNHAAALQLIAEASRLAKECGDEGAVGNLDVLAVTVLTELGRLDDAFARSHDALLRVVALNDPRLTTDAALAYAQLLSRIGEAEAAARLAGSVDAMMERIGLTKPPGLQSEFGALLDRCQQAMSEQTFSRAYDQGRAEMVEDLLTQPIVAARATAPTS